MNISIQLYGLSPTCFEHKSKACILVVKLYSKQIMEEFHQDGCEDS